jgi:hyperosmotically inducible periplasmic protein
MENIAVKDRRCPFIHERTKMTAIFKNSKYFLAIVFLGALLGGCNRNSDEGSSSAPPSESAAPATPAPDTTAPPPPAPAPAPDTSATTPPAGGADTSAAPTTSDTANNAANAAEDTVITAKVKAALLADTEVKGLDIKVETNQGNVSLSGTVNSQAQIDNALRITRNIDGVKNVDNKMTVKAG